MVFNKQITTINKKKDIKKLKCAALDSRDRTKQPRKEFLNRSYFH